MGGVQFSIIRKDVRNALEIFCSRLSFGFYIKLFFVESNDCKDAEGRYHYRGAEIDV